MHEKGALLALGALAAVAIGGCGPSLRRVRTAEQYFERCYAGERDDRYDASEQRACWEAWLASYTVGQSDERIGYARERLLLLDPEQSLLVEMATGEAELAEDRAALEVHEAPVIVLTGTATGAELAPEERTERPETPELRARHRPTPPRSSTARCDHTCMPVWEACVDACGDRERGCHSACRMRFRTCAGACY
jgi:hypothetical protein